MLVIDLKQINKDTVQTLLRQNRIDDIKAIAVASGKNTKGTIGLELGLECLKALQQKLGTEEYTTFYNNLKD